jgi:hypothetical protein
MGIEKHDDPGLCDDPGASSTLAHDLATLTRLLLDLPLVPADEPEPERDPEPVDARRSSVLLAELAFLDE